MNLRRSGILSRELFALSARVSFKNVDKVTDATMEIKYGKSAATMIDPSLLAGYKAQSPELQVLEVPLPENQQSFGNGICIDKSRPEAVIESVEKAVSIDAKRGNNRATRTKVGIKCKHRLSYAIYATIITRGMDDPAQHTLCAACISVVVGTALGVLTCNRLGIWPVKGLLEAIAVYFEPCHFMCSL